MHRFAAATLAALTLATVLAVPASAAPAANTVAIARSAPLHVITARTKPLSWDSFQNHTSAALDKNVGYLENISFWLEYDFVDEARKYMGTARRYLDKELAWLAKYTPAKCFKPVYLKYKAALTAQRDGFVYWHRWLRAYPWGSNRDYSRGEALVKTATTRVNQYNVLVDKTNCSSNSSI